MPEILDGLVRCWLKYGRSQRSIVSSIFKAGWMLLGGPGAALKVMLLIVGVSGAGCNYPRRGVITCVARRCERFQSFVSLCDLRGDCRTAAGHQPIIDFVVQNAAFRASTHRENQRRVGGFSHL